MRCSITAVAALIFCGSLLLPSPWVLSNYREAVTNERGMVVAMARDSRESNADLEPYTEWSSYGFHFVNWSGWHRNGRYVLVPKWPVVTFAASALAGGCLWVRGRAAAG